MIEFLLFCGGSLVIFLGYFRLQQAYSYPFLNPLLLSVVSISLGLLIFGIPYEQYIGGAGYVNHLLEPAVVLLGYPLYKQLPILYKQWRQIAVICALASVITLTVSVCLARVLGLDAWLIKSIVALNITTPVSMSTALELGGSESIAAVVPLIAGLTGSIIGVLWLGWLRIVSKQVVDCEQGTDNPESQKVIGMAIGSVSHAVGTASISKKYPIASAYASTALIICAMITALIAPMYVPFLLSL